MRTLLIIGIGAGDPAHLTLQAVDALRRADVFFVLEKADEQRELVDLRRAILARHVGAPRIVAASDPPRGRGAAAVAAWRHARTDVVEALVRDTPGETGAFLVWGDPSLYDGTIALAEDLIARGAAARYEVIPGIGAVSALAAAHGLVLNRVGGAVQITTGRRLAAGFPEEADDVVVLLDSELAFQGYPDAEIFWGAYLGTPDELLRSGRVGQVGAEIARVRAEARARKGWMFDTYLLRRVRP